MRAYPNRDPWAGVRARHRPITSLPIPENPNAPGPPDSGPLVAREARALAFERAFRPTPVLLVSNHGRHGGPVSYGAGRACPACAHGKELFTITVRAADAA